MKIPMPHQAEAIKKIVQSLGKEARATVTMACGSGKTLVGLWAAERLKATRILVIMPSLALIRQTLHEWRDEGKWPMKSFLCVCSDPSVSETEDESTFAAEDLDFPVTTEPRELADFLKVRGGVKIVFSTYTSSSVLAKGTKRTRGFDLGIFDEAHKTAGKRTRLFSKALSDKNVPIRRRLFMTATPRHYNVRKAKAAYSMDNQKVYGPIIHNLSFAEAIRRKIICDYKVIISVVTEEEMKAEVLRQQKVRVGEGLVNAHHVATQLALEKAVRRFHVNKVITFHRTVADAKRFTGDHSWGAGNHLSDFGMHHVNGRIPTSHRDRIISSFRDSKKAVISNARCLTEGVDVPVVDMVAFMSTKKSTIDIVQAIGRALRRARGKERGYVLVPVLLNKKSSESIEDAVAQSGFGTVWDVLQVLKEQDEAFSRTISKFAQDYRKGPKDPPELESLVICGKEISLSKLKKAISAKTIEVIGESWDKMFGHLVAFKKRYGHCDVPEGYHLDKKLARWVFTQRQTFRHNRLRPLKYRQEQLEKVGFNFYPHAAHWETLYRQLVDFVKIHGHCWVPKTHQPLGNFISVQRTNFHKGKLAPDRIKRLNSIGIHWKPSSSDLKWEMKYLDLVRFKAKHGHIRPSCGSSLETWILLQRRSKHDLRSDRRERLNRLGFLWFLRDPLWEQRYKELVAFKEKNGHLEIPSRKGKSWNPLHAWFRRQQRSTVRRPDQTKRLRDLGVSGI